MNLLLVDLTPSERESFSQLYCLDPPFIPQVRSFCTSLISPIYSADEAELIGFHPPPLFIACVNALRAIPTALTALRAIPAALSPGLCVPAAARREQGRPLAPAAARATYMLFGIHPPSQDEPPTARGRPAGAPRGRQGGSDRRTAIAAPVLCEGA